MSGSATPSAESDPVLGAATKVTRKPGQRWEYGPVSFAGERKAYVTELDTYLQWVNQVELKLKDPAATAQRIRMMYYGSAAGSLSLFDKLITINSQWAGAPLTTNDVPQDTLDGLMGTGKSGPRTDEHARVLRADGTPIPGLYAAGNASVSVIGHSYAGVGATIGSAMTFGYIAALDLAAAQ